MKTARWQISLSTFLLLLTVIALGWSHIVTSRQLAATHNELVDYRYEYGHLVVDDPTRSHVLGYAKQENPWKWHANFSEGKSYKMMCGVGDIPASGIPDISRLSHVQETWITGTGQTKTMFVSLTEFDSKSLNFSIGFDGEQTVSQIIPRSDVYAESAFNSFAVGHGEAFMAEPDEPFVVFYQTERKTSAAGGSTGSSNGVVVWMIPVK